MAVREDGTRVGTYEVHNGAVWHLDVSWDSKLLVSGSADMHAKVWDVETGSELTTFEHTGSVRNCTLDESGRRILVHCDAFGGSTKWPPLVSIYENEPMWATSHRGEGPLNSNYRTRGRRGQVPIRQMVAPWENRSYVLLKMVA